MAPSPTTKWNVAGREFLAYALALAFAQQMADQIGRSLPIMQRDDGLPPFLLHEVYPRETPLHFDHFDPL